MIGRPPDPQRVEYAKLFGITTKKQKQTLLSRQMMHRLFFCRSDEARRLLLGKGERIA